MKLLSTFFGLVMVFMVGCSAIQTGDTTSRLAVQYATLKVIENSSGVDASNVIDAVEKVRSVVTQDITIDVTKIVSSLNLSDLDKSDQILVGSLIGSIEIELYQAPLSDDEKLAKLMSILDWIETAARLS